MTGLPELPPARPQPPIEPPRRPYFVGVAADDLQRDVSDEPLPVAPPTGSPLDSLALALAELVDARATIVRVLRRLEDDRSTDPGPATVHHHLDRAERLINTAADRLARHNCGAAIAGALSASLTAAIERGLSDVRQALETAGGAATAGGRTDSGDVPPSQGQDIPADQLDAILRDFPDTTTEAVRRSPYLQDGIRDAARAAYRIGYAAALGYEITIEDGQVAVGDRPSPEPWPGAVEVQP